MARIEQSGALMCDGHYVYTSGTHGDTYFNKDALFAHVELTAALCQDIAQQFASNKPEVVIGPVAGGVIMSQWVAHFLNQETSDGEVMVIYADKKRSSTDMEPQFIIKRGYDKLIRGKRVLLVDDVLNKGTSLRALRDAVLQNGGEIVGAGCIINRYAHTARTLRLPKLYAIAKLELQIFDAKACELCKSGQPINTDFGKDKV